MKHSTPKLFKIGPTSPFLLNLAKGVLANPLGAKNPEVLARTTVFLPYQRAVTEWTRILRAEARTSSLILPTIRCMDEEDPLFADNNQELHSLTRLGILVRLIRAHQDSQASRGTLPAPPMGVTLRLARSLIGILDQAAIEEADLGGVVDLVDAEFASHWQITLDFLSLILETWPRILADNGWTEPYVAHHHRTNALIEEIQKTGDRHFIVAGSTGTMPATARLIKAVSLHQNGYVVLPGFLMETEADQLYGISHPSSPQHALAKLLRRLEVRPEDVQMWPDTFGESPLRHRLLQKAFSETLTSSSLGESFPTPPVCHETDGISSIHVLPCQNVHEESLAISLILREALETTGLRVTVVTPDPTLARLITHHMMRWDVRVMDTCGVRLSQEPLGTLALFLLDALLKEWAPVSLLALLKHPWVAHRRNPLAKRRWVSLLETQILRGLTPLPGLSPLREAAASSPQKSVLQRGLRLLEEAVRPLTERLPDAVQEVSFWTEALQDSLGLLIGDLDVLQNGSEIIDFLTTLKENGGGFGSLSLSQYREVLQDLLGHQTAVSSKGCHPRIQILGPMEARLIQGDWIILAGLNEGTWPLGDGLDPWLSRPMRDALKMPPPDRRVGLMAHDFCQAHAAQKLFLTRSVRTDGSPSLPSRFLVRLEAAREKERLTFSEETPWLSLARLVDTPTVLSPEHPPTPCPPLSARPRTLSVTQIELWRRDPYTFYARHILKLSPLKALEAVPDRALLGILIHQACEHFVKPETPFTQEAFRAIGQSLCAPYERFPGVRTFWSPRFNQISDWFLVTEQARRLTHPPYETLTECMGSLVLHTETGPFKITARADRIDSWGHTGSLIDYKTGTLPHEDSVTGGFSLQLPLAGAIALAGGFSGLAPLKEIESLDYWGLVGRDKSTVLSVKTPIDVLIHQTLSGLTDLICLFHNPQMPYRARPFPGQALPYKDYHHLARIAGWASESV